MSTIMSTDVQVGEGIKISIYINLDIIVVRLYNIVAPFAVSPHRS